MANPWDLNWSIEDEQPQEAVQQPDGMTQGRPFVPEGEIMPWDQPWGQPELRGPIQDAPQPQPAPAAPKPAPTMSKPLPAAPGYEESALDQWLGITPRKMPANKPNPAGEVIGDFIFRPVEIGLQEAGKDFMQTNNFLWGKPFERGPTPVMAQPTSFKELRDNPREAIPKLFVQGVRFFPAAAAAIGGAAIAPEVLGVTAASSALAQFGAVAGGASAATGLETVAQSLGMNAEEAFRSHPNDPEAAYQQLVATTAIDSGSAAFGALASGFNPFSNMLRNMLAQTFVIQPAIGIAGMEAHEYAAGAPSQPLEDKLVNLLGPSAVMAAGGHAIGAMHEQTIRNPWDHQWQPGEDDTWHYDPDLQNAIPEEEVQPAAAAAPPRGPAPGSARPNDGVYMQRGGIGDNGAPGPKEGFYYKSERVLNDLNLSSASGDQWLATLKGKGIKQEELDDLGLQDMLSNHGAAPVSREQVKAMIDLNRAQFKEVKYGGEQKIENKQYWRVIRQDGYGDGLYDNEARANMHAERIGGTVKSVVQKIDTVPPTKYEKWRLPGGTNYRELVTTIPPKGEPVKPKFTIERLPTGQWTVMDAGKNSYGVFGTEAEARERINLFDKQIPAKQPDPDFRSSHWGGVDNPLMHTRLSDRIGQDGASLLHIEEGQSDVHNEGKKQGYKNERFMEPLQYSSNFDPSKGYVEVVDGNGRFVTNITQYQVRDINNVNEVLGEARRRVAEQPQRTSASRGIWSAPFKKSYYELILKKALKEAAENGYDRLTWTTGDTHAELYGLDRQLEYLRYTKNADGTFDIEAMPKGRHAEIIEHNNITEKSLADVVGVAVADKIKASEGRRTTGQMVRGKFELRGDDLKVENKGKRQFYDVMWPSFLNKFGKKFGVKVGQERVSTVMTEIPPEHQYAVRGNTVYDAGGNAWDFNSPEEAQRFIDKKLSETASVHSFQITPEMRLSILREGQPYYQKPDETFAKRIVAAVGDDAAFESIFETLKSLPAADVLQVAKELHSSPLKKTKEAALKAIRTEYTELTRHRGQDAIIKKMTDNNMFQAPRGGVEKTLPSGQKVRLSKVSLTPEERKHHGRMLKQMERDLKAAVPHAKVVFYKKLSVEAGGEKGNIPGMYYPSPEVGPLIIMALEVEGRPNYEINMTKWHESWHALQESGLVRDHEIRTLEDYARKNDWAVKYRIDKRYATDNDAVKMKETIAEGVGDILDKRDRGIDFMKYPKPVRKILIKIKNALKAIARNARRFMGEDATAEDIIDRIYSGEIGWRQQSRGEGDIMAQRAHWNTPAFKRWFSNSKVVDDNGDPLVVYHGTTSDFSSFDRVDGGNQYGPGHYFAFDPESASRYATGEVNRMTPAGDGVPNVMPVYLKAEKIYDRRKVLTASQLSNLEASANRRHPGMWKRGELAKMFDRAYPANGDNVAYQLASTSADEANAIIRGAGFDAIRDNEMIAVFDKSQIKSATGNSGDYSRKTDNILMQRAHWDTPEFKRFSKGLPIVQDGGLDYQGGPAVFETFHGTTHDDITTFKTGGYSGSYLGEGPYFTTAPEDASANYAGVGPDLMNRIEGKAEDFTNHFWESDDNAHEMLTDLFEAEGWDTSGPEFKKGTKAFEDLKHDKVDDAVHFAATNELKGKTEGLMMKTYVRLEKPADTTGRSPDLTRDFTEDEDGNIITDDGPMSDWIAAAVRVGDDTGVDMTSYVDEINGYGDSIGMNDLFDMARQHLDGHMNDQGEYLTWGAVFKEIAKEAGYDGVIMDADEHFGSGRGRMMGIRTAGMAGVEPGTLHIVPFDPEKQVKSATGNRGTYSEEPNILLQRKHWETPEFKRFFDGSVIREENGDPRVMYHSTTAEKDFDTFKRRASDIGIHFGTREQAESRFREKSKPREFFKKEQAKERGRTIPAYLAIKNPLRLRDIGAWTPDNMLYGLVDSGKFTEAEARRAMLGAGVNISSKIVALQKLIESKGYDGIVYKNTGEVAGDEPYARAKDEAKAVMEKRFGHRKFSFSVEDQQVPEYQAYSKAMRDYEQFREANGEDSYIVFHPNQIKSAIGNSGAYGRSGNILFQKKGGKKDLPPNEVIIEHAPIPKNDQGLPDTRDITNWPAQKTTIVVGAVGKFLEAQTLAANGGKPLNPWDPVDHHRITQTAIAEARDQFMQKDHGANWYASEVEEAFRLASIVSPRLAHDEVARSIMSIMAAISSNGNRAGQNWRYAMLLFEHYEKTGDVIDKNPRSGQIFGQKGHTIAIGLRGLDRMIKEMGEAEAAEWILTNHPIKELREMQVRMGWKAGTVTGKQFDTRMGAFMFGPKIGPFLLNIHGISEATIDSWMMRQWGRYVGELTSGANLDAQGLRAMPSTPKERGLVIDMVTKVGEALGIEPQDAQALLWYYEQRLYRSLGAKSARSESFTDGARAEINARGLKDITPPKQSAGKPGVQGRLGSSDAPQIEGPKGPPKGDILLQRKDPGADGQRQLIAVHNVTASNLAHSEKLGGLPAPSLAVIKPEHPFYNFGEITLVATPELVDPARGAKVYGSDVYSPRYPEVDYKVDKKAHDRLWKSLAAESKQLGFLLSSELDENAISNKGLDAFDDSSVAMLKYAREKGVDVPLKTFDRADWERRRAASEARKNAAWDAFHSTAGDDPDRAAEREWRLASNEYAGIMNEERRLNDDAVWDLKRKFRGDPGYMEWVRQNYSDLIKNERIVKGRSDRTGALQFAPHTLESVVKVMTKSIRDGEGFNYGVPSIRSTISPQFRSVKQMRDRASKLVPREKMELIKEEVNSEFTSLADRFSKMAGSRGKEFGFLDSFSEQLKEIAIRRDVKGVLKQYYPNVTDEDAIAVGDFMTKLRDLETQYFEAKIPRGVGVGEFAGAVVPDNASAETIARLKRQGVKDIRTYKAGDEADRARVVGEFKHVMFRRPIAAQNPPPRAAQAAPAQGSPVISLPIPQPNKRDERKDTITNYLNEALATDL